MTDTAAAAVAEVDGRSPVIHWRDLELTLPAKVPPTVLFDVVECEADEDALAMFRLLRSLLGGEQFTDVRNAIREDDDINTLVVDLFEQIFGEYGSDPGEASASPKSS